MCAQDAAGGGQNDTYIAKYRDDKVVVARPAVNDWWWDDGNGRRGLGGRFTCSLRLFLRTAARTDELVPPHA
jgi:hypothetical protein